MSKAKAPWICHKVSGGEKCGQRNPRRLKKCQKCGKPRSTVSRPEHMKALLEPYESFVERNGGEYCGICGKPREPGKPRLHRDHRHRGQGHGRGLLDWACNDKVPESVTLRWARQLVAYLEKYEDEDGNPLY